MDKYSTRHGIENLERDLKKSLNFQMNKLSEVLKGVEIQKEKKGKVNKKPATMAIMIDKSIVIRFDDPNEADKLFAGFK